jgi:translation initiation factor 1 (eIF-1/SUI1)
MEPKVITMTEVQSRGGKNVTIVRKFSTDGSRVTRTLMAARACGQPARHSAKLRTDPVIVHG